MLPIVKAGSPGNEGFVVLGNFSSKATVTVNDSARVEEFEWNVVSDSGASGLTGTVTAVLMAALSASLTAERVRSCVTTIWVVCEGIDGGGGGARGIAWSWFCDNMSRSSAKDGGMSNIAGPEESRRWEEIRGMSSNGIIEEILWGCCEGEEWRVPKTSTDFIGWVEDVLRDGWSRTAAGWSGSRIAAESWSRRTAESMEGMPQGPRRSGGGS
jgi:hypothetical protein